MTSSNTIIHADCVEALARFNSASVDFVRSDPFYVNKYQDRVGRTIRNDGKFCWLRPAFQHIHRVLRGAIAPSGEIAKKIAFPLTLVVS